MTFNKYIYFFEGESVQMNAHDYSNFLQRNSPQAYKMHNTGKHLTIAGFCCLQIGIGAFIGGVCLAVLNENKTAGIPLSVLGGATLGGSIAMLILGKRRREKAIDMYNNQISIKDKTQTSFSLGFSSTCVGFCMKF